MGQPKLSTIPLENGRVPGYKAKTAEDVGLRVAPTEPQGTPEQITQLAELKAKYKDKSATEILHFALTQDFPKTIAAVSSFGSESVVLLHLIAQENPETPVLFLNTGKLFGETLRYRDRLQETIGLTHIRAIGPHPKDLHEDDPKGALWTKDTDACCHIRKVLPLKRAMEGFDASITGRKQFQTSARANLDVIELAQGKFRLNSLANWSHEDLLDYIKEHNLPRHPLVDDGYLSIGCMPCTERVKDGDYRSGRWIGETKDECGIHYPIGGLTDGEGI